jgi:hypothetical protein
VALSDEVYPFWGGGKEELTGRMSSTARCGRPEGNGGGGGGKEELTRRMSLTTRCGRLEGNGGGGGGKEELTGRMSSTARCGRPEGNGGEGGVQGWWSTALGAGGCTRRRGARGMVETVEERAERRRKKGCSMVGVGALYSCKRRWMTAAWRWGNSGRVNGGGEAMGVSKAAAAV